MADRAFHLWRKYPTEPYRRWACTVRQEDTEDGFRVIDYDDHVADIHFLHTMQDTLRAHHPVRDSVEHDGVLVETRDYAGPDHPEHFETAIRLVPNAVLRGTGRPV